MQMLKRYEILKNVKSCSQTPVALPEEPVMVATVIDEADLRVTLSIRNGRNAHIEDRMHDWDWNKGKFRFYPRVNDVCDVLVVYEFTEVRFDPMTGERIER